MSEQHVQQMLEQSQGAEGAAPERTPAQPERKRRPSGAWYRKRARERSRAASQGLGDQASSPLGAGIAAEIVLAGRSVEEALDSDSKVRCALTRLVVAVLDGRIERQKANAATFTINAIAARLDQEAAKAAKLRELELREREIETARELAQRLEEFRAQAPQQLVQAVQVHVPALLGDAAAAGVRVSARVLEHDGEVTP